MKIEKINDKQIRCTISRADLEDRHIKFSELAFGSGKSKELFQDMIRQANEDFGFEINDKPLMVEALPVSPENIVLLITRVEDGDERNDHLSKLFSKEVRDNLLDSYDDINLDDFDSITAPSGSTDASDDGKDKSEDLFYSISVFDSLRDIITVAELIAPIYKGDSSVYKSPDNGKYYLTLCMESSDQLVLNKICGIITEYGAIENATYVKDLFYQEHFEEIIYDHAVDKLAAM